TQRGQVFRAHFLPDPHRAVSLHIAMSTNGTDPCSLSTDLSPEQRKIYNRLDICDAVAMLRNTHRPGANHSFGFHRDLRRLMNQIAGYATVMDDPVPAFGANVPCELVKPFGVVIDEIMREDLSAGSVILLQHLLHDALEHSDVSIDPHRQEQTCQVRTMSEQVQRLLRIFESHEACFYQGVDAHNSATVLHRLLQFRQHARVACSRVLADHENGVRMGKI